MKSKIFTSLLALACAATINAQLVVADFESAADTIVGYGYTTGPVVVENPVAAGNPSDSVLLMDMADTGIWGAMTTINLGLPKAFGDFNTLYIDINSDQIVRCFVRLWVSDTGKHVGEDASFTGKTTAVDTWQTITMDISPYNWINLDSISLQFGGWNADDGDTVPNNTYVDNIKFDYFTGEETDSIPETLFIHKATAAVDVDITFELTWDEATEAEPIVKPAVDVNDGLDVSGEFYALWDEDYVYLWVDVTDDDVFDYDDGEGTESWNNDGMEIFTDGEAHNWVGARVNSKQLQSRFNVGRAEDDCSSALRDTIISAQAKTTNGYSFEFAIPMFQFFRPYEDDDAAGDAAVTANAVIGTELGIELSILDAQAIDDRDGIVNWANPTGGDVAYTNSQYYGAFVLDHQYKNNEIVGSDIKVYPNPASSMVMVQMTNLSRVEVCTLDGRVVVQKAAQAGKAEITVSNLASGMYIIKAIDANNMYTTSKFQKQQ